MKWLRRTTWLARGRAGYQSVPFLLAALLMVCAGCYSAPSNLHDEQHFQLFRSDYAAPRLRLAEGLPEKRDKPDYLLDRIRLGMLSMLDGYPFAGEAAIEEAYEILRTQGVNRDKTMASVVLNEDLKIWKGEPFEQAMALVYIGVHYGIQGDWGNLRAAADNSLFQLRDFGVDRAKVPGRSADATAEDGAAYKPVESNFTLGYLLHGLANHHLAQAQLADESFAHVTHYDAKLQPLVSALKAGDYNTVFVVDYGTGPAKRLSGTDGEEVRFVPQTRSDGAMLRVTDARGVQRHPQVADVNTMAQSLMWNSMETARRVKSGLGNAMLIGGLGTAAVSRDRDTQLVGLAVAAAGLFAKAGAHGDPRYLELLPQRVYVVPAQITEAQSKVTLEVDGHPWSRTVVWGLEPPPAGQVQIRYLRLTDVPAGPWPWQVSGQSFYSNVHEPEAGAANYPYILGGDDVRPPSPEVMLSYQRDGYLNDMMLQELRDLYQREDIQLDSAIGQQPGRHVLEGGRSLVSPIPGSTGYLRIFGVKHRPFAPRYEGTEQWRDRLASPENTVISQPR